MYPAVSLAQLSRNHSLIQCMDCVWLSILSKRKSYKIVKNWYSSVNSGNETAVEALHLHSNTQSHWSSGSTVCFLPRGPAFPVKGMHPQLLRNWDLLLVMSRYIGCPRCDPWSPAAISLFARNLAMTLASDCLSHAFPSSILLLAGPPPPGNTNPLINLLGGGGGEACGGPAASL